MVTTTSLDKSHQIDLNKNALLIQDIVMTGNLYNQGATSTSGVISGKTTSYTLLPTDAGKTVLFDSAAGIIYTLPPPQVGLDFSFFVTVSCTSNAHKIITDAGTTFLTGTVQGCNTASADATLAFSGNATTHLAYTQAAASTNATGGLIGSWVRAKCVSSTLWLLNGVVNAGTTHTTPFATS